MVRIDHDVGIYEEHYARIIQWNNLYKLAENTFVEESDSLKQDGAGAGLTDND